VLTQSVPASRIAEAYRGLRTTISMMWIGNAKREGDPNAEHSDSPRVLMIASPGPSEGKSTTAANLAATYAETGRKVIVIDLDQRRQKLHKFVGASMEPHLAWADEEQTRIDFDALLQDTTMARVKFINSPDRTVNPGEAMALIRHAVEWARNHADIVLL